VSFNTKKSSIFVFNSKTKTMDTKCGGCHIGISVPALQQKPGRLINTAFMGTRRAAATVSIKDHGWSFKNGWGWLCPDCSSLNSKQLEELK